MLEGLAMVGSLERENGTGEEGHGDGLELVLHCGVELQRRATFLTKHLAKDARGCGKGLGGIPGMLRGGVSLSAVEESGIEEVKCFPSVEAMRPSQRHFPSRHVTTTGSKPKKPQLT